MSDGSGTTRNNSSDVAELLTRLRTRQHQLEAALQETADENAHHLQHALEAIRTAIKDVQERFGKGDNTEF